MESDIIIEEFLKADKLGVRYMNIIGDGDSSVYARIREEVPVWGANVKKGECANHVCKCLRSNLEKLVEENPAYKGRGNLTKNTRIRLVSAVRCAIRMRTNQNAKNKARLLEKDIKNSVHHIYGNHQNCSADVCQAKKVKKSDSANKQENTSETSLENDYDNDSDDVMLDQFKLWKEGSSVGEQEEARGGTAVSCNNTKLISDISFILNKVASKADRLIGNFTTNLAECWMHIRTKFDGEKVFNHCSRGSWHTRCFAGGLRFNEGPKWSANVWEKTTETSPGDNFKLLYEKRDKCLMKNNESKNTQLSKLKRWKRKSKLVTESMSKKARLEYGAEARDIEPDVSDEELNKTLDAFIKNQINISESEKEKIAKNTIDQSRSKLWNTERKKRVTSSNFGGIVRRNPKIKVAPLVKSILYSTFKGSKFTKIGLQNEPVSVNDYVEVKKLNNEKIKFEKMGLIVSRDYPFLAASPDGKVTDQNGNVGLIEIKNILYNKPVTLSQEAKMKSIKIFCLEMNKNTGKLHLKTKHNYFYQCQGLLLITKFPWFDFVVRTESPYELHIERIFFDEQLCTDVMIPKLKAFYYKALLPEIVLPRHGKIPGIREPGIWYTTKKPLKDPKTCARSPMSTDTAPATVTPTPEPIAGPSTISSRRLKVPQNWKQRLQNDLNSVDWDVKPQIKQAQLQMINKLTSLNLCEITQHHTSVIPIWQPSETKLTVV